MAKPSDREYQLRREIKQLKELNLQLELQVAKLKKQLEKNIDPTYEAPVGRRAKNKPNLKKITCPGCESEIKSTELPHAILELCSNGCGWRQVKPKGK